MLRRRELPLLLLLTVAAGSAAAPLAAAASKPVATAPRAPAGGAVTGITLVLEGGKRVENGTLLFRDGTLVAAGPSAEVAIPADVVPRDGRGWTAWPGLIELHDVRATVGGESRAPLFAPAGAEALAGDAERNRKLREAGFVLSLVSAKEGILRGPALVATLGDGPLEDRLVVRDAAYGVRMQRAENGYPSSTMGAVAATRQAFVDARWQEEAERAYAQNGSQPRPRRSATSAGLLRAARGAQTVVFESDSPSGTVRAATIARELGLDAWLVGSGREAERIEELRAANRPLVLPLRFPDKPKAPKEGERGPELDVLRAWALAAVGPA
jgi:hypothetical protein